MNCFRAAAPFVTALLVSAPAFAQSPGAQEPPPAAPANVPPTPPTNAATTYEPPAMDARTERFTRWSLGADAQLLIPVGALSDASGLLLGPQVRVGYRVARPLELTLRTAYLFGLTKDTGTSPVTGNGGLNVVPAMFGGRFFFFPEAEDERQSVKDRGAANRYSGLYAAAEVGLNMIIPKAEVNGVSVENLDTRIRFGGNFGLGYVISKHLPIDLRAQASLLNVFGKEDQIDGAIVNEKTLVAIGVSAGYTVQF